MNVEDVVEKLCRGATHGNQRPKGDFALGDFAPGTLLLEGLEPLDM